MALASSSWDGQSAVGAGHETGAPEALAFMPRLFVLTTLPHRRPQGNRFERVNGWQSLRMVAPRRVGLPYGVYPRLLPIFVATEAMRKKSREITRSAVPVDLQAIHQLKGSPLALDLYTWLTYRMSYLRKPTLVPWKGLQAQLGADYARPSDFRRTVLARLQEVVSVYPELRIQRENEGLRLYPTPSHVKSRSLKRSLRLAPSPEKESGTRARI